MLLLTNCNRLLFLQSPKNHKKLKIDYFSNFCYQTYSQVKKKVTSVYKRKLPKDLIPFSSPQGQRILIQSLLAGYGVAYFYLIQQFVTQLQPSTCGSSSLSMILNTLRVDPKINFTKNWKGIWRWYDDNNIFGITQHQLAKGLTLQQWSYLARLNKIISVQFYIRTKLIENILCKNQRKLRVFNHQTLKSLIKFLCGIDNIFITINFSRKALGQTGEGHFSPIAAYHPQQELALILDVAKFKYTPYWCSADKLITITQQLDKVSQLPRGFILNKNLNWFLQNDKLSGKATICDWGFNKFSKQQVEKFKQNYYADQYSSVITPLLVDLCFSLGQQTIYHKLQSQIQKNPKFLLYLEHFQLKSHSIFNDLIVGFLGSQKSIPVISFIMQQAIKGSILTKQYLRQNRNKTKKPFHRQQNQNCLLSYFINKMKCYLNIIQQ